MISPSDAIDSEYSDHGLQLPESAQLWVRDIEANCPGVRFISRPTWLAGETEICSGRAKRQREFLTGRRCTAYLLSGFGEYQPVKVNDDRSPIWPNGFVGSISHSEHWTIAAVARANSLRSIGIDTEPVMSVNSCEKLASMIATDEEKDRLRFLGLSPEASLTLIFSAKESFYKCWYPISKSFIEFSEVVITEVSDGAMIIEPTSRGSVIDLLDVKFQVCDQDIFTATWLENDA